ncbi:FYVE, RhoGEF and PH domain-containing protein 2-like isoform X3 [Argonauta hians]
MDSDDSSSVATATDAASTDQQSEPLPNRPIPYRHKTKPPLPNKPRPPLPVKPNITLPKKPPIAHVKPLTSKRSSSEFTSNNQTIVIHSPGKGKAPPPPPPASPSSSSTSTSSSSSSTPPQLPPKDTSPPPPTPKKPSGGLSSSPVVNVKKSPFTTNDIQTKILNSVRNNANLKISNSSFSSSSSSSSCVTTSTTIITSHTCLSDNNNNHNNNRNSSRFVNEKFREKEERKSVPRPNTPPEIPRKVFPKSKSVPPTSPKVVTTRLAFGSGNDRSSTLSAVEISESLNNNNNNSENIRFSSEISQKNLNYKLSPDRTSFTENHHPQLQHSPSVEGRRVAPPPPVKPKPRPKPRERPIPKRRLSIQRQNSIEFESESNVAATAFTPTTPTTPTTPPITTATTTTTSLALNSDVNQLSEWQTCKLNNNYIASSTTISSSSCSSSSSITIKNNNNSIRAVSASPTQSHRELKHSANNSSFLSDVDNVDTSLRVFEECVNNILKSQENINSLSSSPETSRTQIEVERSRTRAPQIPVRDYNHRSSSVDRFSGFRSSHKSWSETSSNCSETDEPVRLPSKTRINSSPFDLLLVNTDSSTPPKPPARPPRPKHEEIKRSRSKLTASDIQFLHVDFTSSQQAQELGAPTLTRQKSETRKTCPPKPARKNLRRCRSDATDHRSNNHDTENIRNRSMSQNSEKTTSDMSTMSGSTNKIVNRPDNSSPNISKSPVPAPPRRWYGREHEPTKSLQIESDDSNINNNEVARVIDRNSGHTYEITEANTLSFFSSPKIPYSSPKPVSRAKSKERSPTPPHIPPRNYNDNEDISMKTTADNDRVFSQQCDNNNEGLESSKDSSNNHCLKVDSDIYNSNDNVDKSPTFKHNRPLSSISQISLPSDSGSGSAEMQNANSILSSGTDSSEDESGQTNTDRSAKKVYYIAEEIMNSEKVFVRVLCLINVDFRMAVSNATEKAGRPVIPSDVLNRILDFLPQLQNFNEDLLSDLENRVKNWDSIKKISDIFVKKGPFLKLYTSYIRNFKNMQTLFEESCRKYPAFAATVKEFKSHPECQKLDLTHHMLKPVQRIPQYRLLLSEYLKYLTPESPDYKDTLTALDIVSKVSEHANERIRQGDNVHKLMEIQCALIGNFEVIHPGRELIKMGELTKLSRKEMQPRVFILFNDTLLYTTPVPGGYKLINILPLAGMKVKKTTLDDFKNEFDIISIQRSFKVCANTSTERDDWIDAISKAIEDHTLKRNSFEVNRTQVHALEKGFVLGSKAPLWVPDTRVTMCMLCTCEFTVMWRRHHCRACGRVTCGNCSNNKAPLFYLNYEPSRVCDECNKILYEEIEQQAKQVRSAKEQGRTVEVEQPPEDLLSRFHKIRKSGHLGQKNIKRPAWLKEVHANDQGSTMSGYLKLLYKGKRWKQFWFVLKDKVLYKYKASEDMAAIQSLPLLGYKIRRISESPGCQSSSLGANHSSDLRTQNQWCEGIDRRLLFELDHKGMQPMRLQTESAELTDKWVTVLEEAVVP